jgi:hypothetical protein
MKPTIEAYRLQQLINAAGGMNPLAELLGLEHSTPFKWRKNGRISLAGASLVGDSKILRPFRCSKYKDLYFHPFNLRPGIAYSAWQLHWDTSVVYLQARKRQKLYEKAHSGMNLLAGYDSVSDALTVINDVGLELPEGYTLADVTVTTGGE